MITEMSEVSTILKIPTFNHQLPQGRHEVLGLPVNQNRLTRIVPEYVHQITSIFPIYVKKNITYTHTFTVLWPFHSLFLENTRNCEDIPVLAGKQTTFKKHLIYC